MPRAQATDPLHGFRFHARASAGNNAGLVSAIGEDPLQPGGSASAAVGDGSEAGFQACSTPDYTVEASEYREGLKTYTEKYPGIPTTSEVTFSRGVARADTAFYDWVTAVIEGRDYRADVTYFHAIRQGRSSPFSATNDFVVANTKRYILRNAFPMRVKPAADMDASTSDVSLAEIDISYEKFDIRIPGQAGD